MTSADALAEFRSRIEVSDWRIVSWEADNHDSVTFSIHKHSHDTDFLLTLLVTELEEGTHHHLELGRITNEGSSRYVLKDSISNAVDPQDVASLLELGMARVESFSAENDLPASAGELDKLSFREELVAADVILRNVVSARPFPFPFLAQAPAEVKDAYYRLGLVSIKRNAEIELELLGHSLAEELSRLDAQFAVVQASARQSDINNIRGDSSTSSPASRSQRLFRPLYRDMFSSRGHEAIVNVLFSVTLLGLAVMLYTVAYNSFRFLIASTASLPTIVPSVASLSAAAGYAGGIMLCAYFSATSLRSLRRRNTGSFLRMYGGPIFLLTVTVAVLPLAIFAAAAFLAPSYRFGYNFALFLVTVIVSALITLVFYFLGPGGGPTVANSGNGEDDETREMRIARLQSLRRSVLRVHLQQASVLIAETEMKSTEYIRSASIYYNDTIWWEHVDTRPEAAWIHRAERNLREKREKSERFS